ncbi:MAG: tetratricopeptide repeat protein [Chitinophagales bacterium]
MKKATALVLSILCFGTMIGSFSCSGRGKEDNTVAGLVPVLRSKAPEENIKAFEEVIKESKEDPEVIKLLGLYAYLNRQLGLAAWCYARAAEKKPDDFINLSNLGLCLHELYLADKEKKDSMLFQKSLYVFKRAVKGDPDNPSIQNNLGYALYQEYLETKDPTSLAQAEMHLRKAVSIEPDAEIALCHLAETLAAQNKNGEAVALLNKVHSINPFNGVLTQVMSGQLGEIYKQANPPCHYCDSINFNCDKCRGSIIGGLEFVQCKMDEQAAGMDCRQGKPYAKFFKCGEMGDSPWMIPGLQSGLCILTPAGKLCLMLHGDGTVDFKLEIQSIPGLPEGLKFGFDGTYDPSGGESKININGSYSINLFKRGEVAELLNKFDVGPISIKAQVPIKGDDKPGGSSVTLQAETYGVPAAIPLTH